MPSRQTFFLAACLLALLVTSLALAAPPQKTRHIKTYLGLTEGAANLRVKHDEDDLNARRTLPTLGAMAGLSIDLNSSLSIAAECQYLHAIGVARSKKDIAFAYGLRQNVRFLLGPTWKISPCFSIAGLMGLALGRMQSWVHQGLNPDYPLRRATLKGFTLGVAFQTPLSRRFSLRGEVDHTSYGAYTHLLFRARPGNPAVSAKLTPHLTSFRISLLCHFGARKTDSHVTRERPQAYAS